MSEAEDEGRDHEPSQKKLDDARARGDILRSADLNAAVALAALVGVILVGGGWACLSFGTAAVTLWADAARGGGGVGGSLPAAARMAGPVLPLFLAPALAVLALVWMTRGAAPAPANLAPRLSRIDPLGNARRRFGAEGLADFARSLAKAALVAAAMAWFLKARMPDIAASAAMEARLAVAFLLRQVADFLVLMAALSLALGAADYLWQRLRWRRRNRMTRQELMDEHREAEGDPHVKGQRRQRAMAIALNRMLADVPKADVVIVNPEHYAVALRWRRASRRAPVCLAKGTDEVAARIRLAAAAAGVPIRPDPPTARALFAAVEIGREIRPEHYAPVAAAIRFAERMRRHARERGVPMPRSPS